MISGHSLTAVLHALSTGFADRALNIIVTTDELEDGPSCAAARPRRSASNELPEDQARALGDAFRDADGDQFLVNECYRVGLLPQRRDWSELADNPLYAHFVANRAGPVLDKWPHYFPIYARHLTRFRGEPVRVLEIGVYRGGGLELWQNYLGPEAQLVGLDIDEAAVRAADGRYPGRARRSGGSRGAAASSTSEYGPFDIVIDDGGHTMRQQIVVDRDAVPAAQRRRRLPRRGLPHLVLAGVRRRACAARTRSSNGPSAGSTTCIRAITSASTATRSGRPHLDGLHVYDSVVVFDKKHRFRPFNEVVGSSSYLFADRFSEGTRHRDAGDPGRRAARAGRAAGQARS